MKYLKYIFLFLLVFLSLLGYTFYTMQPLFLRQQEKIILTDYNHRPFYTFYNKLFEEEDWRIIWSDEFNKPQIDIRKWNLVDWEANKNNELQYYNPSNAFVDDGLLRLRSDNTATNNKPYTSGSVDTRNKMELLYGKIEIRARLPKGKGMFPAFWLLPANDQPLPEIDIVELLGHEPNKVWMVYHWLDKNGQKEKSYTYYEGPDFSEDFNTFTLEWYPDKILWFINDNEVFSFTEHSPAIPLYLIINTAVGGNWPGSPDKSSTFPQFLDIDYVRVYTQNNSR